MTNGNVMDWINRLPEVGEPILNERKAIQALMQQSVELEKQAAEIRGQAYVQALRLESRCRDLWTEAQIEQAKRG